MKRVLLAALLFLSIVTSSTSTAQSVPQGEPILQELQETDFVELQRTRCFGTCPDYTVRIYGDGRVQWKGNQFVEVTGKATAAVPPQRVLSLIQKFVADGFWNLSGSYSINATDGDTATTVLHVGKKQKSVSNYFRTGPAFLQVLEYEVDALADTHRWIHGDPQREFYNLSNGSTDGTRPKPGVTLLMRAVYMADTLEIQRQLNSRSPLDAQDSSGWTALVYAAKSLSPYPLKVLLDSGANPNIRSFMGQTPLTAAIMGFPTRVEKVELLIAAGADVNVRDTNGQTALMALVTGGFERSGTGMYFQQLEICSTLLAAGARTDLRDVAGLTVFDILERELKRSTKGIASERSRAMRAQHEELLTVLRNK